MEDLIVNIILGVLDAVIFYITFCALTEREFRLLNIRIGKYHITYIPIKYVFTGLIWGALLGLCKTNLRDDVYTIIFHSTIILMIAILSRKKLYHIMILFVLINVCIFTVQFPLAIFFYLIKTNVYISTLVGQTLTLIFIIFMNKKYNIHKLLDVVEKELTVKLVFFALNVMFFIVMAYFEFSYETLQPYGIYLLVFVFISIAGFARTIAVIHYYTKMLPTLYHDTNNALAGMYITLNSTDDLKEIRSEAENCLTILGMNVRINNEEKEKAYNKLISFIEYEKQKQSGWKKIDLIKKVYYSGKHPVVPDFAILIMIGTLLDNAFEANISEKTVYLYVNISDEEVIIEVANECIRKSDDDFDKMFKEGFSTKDSNNPSRGHGLPNLSRMVRNNFNGRIELRHEYNEKEKTDYLKLTIII